MATGDQDLAHPEQVGLLLKEVLQLNRWLALELARAAGIGLTDFLALEDLLGDGPLGPMELGRRQGLGSAASTALADRLERAGHVVRHPHPEDRRRIALTATDHAMRTGFEVLMPVIKDLIGVAERLDDDERAVVARYLREVADVIRRHLDAG